MVNWFKKKDKKIQQNNAVTVPKTNEQTKVESPQTTQPITANSNRSDGDSKELIRKGAQTPLHIAAASNNLDAARKLIHEGANMNALNTWGATPLHLAVSNNNLEMARLLINNGADATIKNGKGEIPAFIARFGGNNNREMILLLEAAYKKQFKSMNNSRS